MAEFIEVMEARKELCKNFVCNSTCPLRRKALEYDTGCHGFFGNYPEEAEQIIMEWKGNNNDVTTDCEDCKARIRAEVIDEFKEKMILARFPLYDPTTAKVKLWEKLKETALSIAEQLKEQKNGKQ